MCHKCKDAVDARYNAAVALRTVRVEGFLRRAYDHITREPIPEVLQETLEKLEGPDYAAH